MSPLRFGCNNRNTGKDQSWKSDYPCGGTPQIWPFFLTPQSDSDKSLLILKLAGSYHLPQLRPGEIVDNFLDTLVHLCHGFPQAKFTVGLPGFWSTKTSSKPNTGMMTISAGFGTRNTSSRWTIVERCILARGGEGSFHVGSWRRNHHGAWDALYEWITYQ